jgi:hypothetical protein
MANKPSLHHVTFVDVDLKMNHLPEAFNVLVSPTLRYKHASNEYNSQKRWFSDYDLAGYRTIEGDLNFGNVLKFIQSVKFSGTSSQNDERDWAKDIQETRHRNKVSSSRVSFSSSANHSTLRRIVMRTWHNDPMTNKTNKTDVKKGSWIGIFTNLIDGLVGKDKSHPFLIPSDDLENVVKNLQKLKHHKSKKQWMENPLVKNERRDKTYTRPKRKEREPFKVICNYVTKAIKDTTTELQRMTGKQKIDQSFASIKNNLDKYLKLLKGKITTEKRLGKVLVEPVHKMLKFVGLLQPKTGSAQFICKK